MDATLNPSQRAPARLALKTQTRTFRVAGWFLRPDEGPRKRGCGICDSHTLYAYRSISIKLGQRAHAAGESAGGESRWARGRELIRPVALGADLQVVDGERERKSTLALPAGVEIDAPGVKHPSFSLSLLFSPETLKYQTRRQGVQRFCRGAKPLALH